jgi:hypothetical protein
MRANISNAADFRCIDQILDGDLPVLLCDRLTLSSVAAGVQH